MKYDSRTFGHAEAIFNILGGDEAVGRILRGELEVKVTEKVVVPSPPILALFATFELPARAEKLVVADEFVVGKHGIKYVDPSFTRAFGNLTEEPSEGGTFASSTLSRAASVAEMSQERGSKATTMLGDALAQMDKQSQGQEGPLLMNGWANIFECKDAAGNSFAVLVFWSADRGGWVVYCYGVAIRGYDGRRFFPRN